MLAVYATPDGDAVFLRVGGAEDTPLVVAADDPRLEGIAIEAFVPPAAPVPRTLRLLQFLAAMVGAGLITGDEALAAARTGAVPAAVEAVLETLPAPDAFAGRLAWAAMIEVDRDNPLLLAVAAAHSITAEGLDALFVLAAGIAP